MINKKGVSSVIITILMIVIVLGVVAILWGVVNSVIGEGTSDISSTSKCLKPSVVPTQISCSGSDCTVTIEKNSDGTAIDGVKLIFTNATQNFIYDEAGTMGALQVKTVSNIATGLTNVQKVGAVVYFTDDAGNDNPCEKINELAV